MRHPPLIWATHTVLCFGCLPFAAALALDGWRRPTARLWAALASLAALLPLATISWAPEGKAWIREHPRLLLLAVALNLGFLLLGWLHGGVDLRRWGAGLGDWRWWAPRTGLLVLGTFLLSAVWFAVDPGMRAYYPNDPMAREGLGGLLLYCGILAFYMVGWESFWRGSLLFGLARCWGPLAAILFGGLPFFLLHRGKPDTELVGSFVVGCLLSWFCYRGRSLWPGVILHAVLNLSVQLAGFAMM
jgi:membrane protease YdiL (CAAX protease family)